MREVFSGEQSDGMNIRNLLESRGVEVFVTNESMSNIKPSGFNLLVLKVNDSDFEMATKIIQDYDDGILDYD